MEEQEEEYVKLGTYPKWEAEQLLNSFVNGNVRFRLSTEDQNKAVPRSQNPDGQRYPSGTTVLVHIEDSVLAMEIQNRVFKLDAPADEKENLYEEIVSARDDFPKCPKCSSVDILHDAFAYRNFFIYLMPWLWGEKRWFCRKCNHIWE